MLAWANLPQVRPMCSRQNANNCRDACLMGRTCARLRWNVMTLQEQYDDAMFDFSTGDYDRAIEKFKAVLAEDPKHFDAQLSLGMAYYRKGDYATAIAEGRKAEKLKPGEQLVHTNLSLFYMKAGDKTTAEHHGMQARIASWKSDKSKPGEAA